MPSTKIKPKRIVQTELISLKHFWSDYTSFKWLSASKLSTKIALKTFLILTTNSRFGQNFMYFGLIMSCLKEF